MTYAEQWPRDSTGQRWNPWSLDAAYSNRNHGPASVHNVVKANRHVQDPIPWQVWKKRPPAWPFCYYSGRSHNANTAVEIVLLTATRYRRPRRRHADYGRRAARLIAFDRACRRGSRSLRPASRVISLAERHG